MPNVLQRFQPSGTLGRFPNQQPGGLPILTLLEFQAINLVALLVVA